MDETYQTYINRVAPMTLPTHHQTQLQNIQQSAKFASGKPVSFPGYSVITPPWCDDPDNHDVYQRLQEYQEQLLDQLEPDLVITVPPSSFHLTLADLIWDRAYKDALAQNPQFDSQLRERISESFAQYRQSTTGKTSPVQLQLLGLSLFPRAIAVCLVPQEEEGYEVILQLRRSIYQNEGIVALGIEQQYHFTAHITLAYFGPIGPQLDREEVVTTLEKINQSWLDHPTPPITIQRAELRYFEDMMDYKRELDWPTVEI